MFLRLMRNDVGLFLFDFETNLNTQISVHFESRKVRNITFNENNYLYKNISYGNCNTIFKFLNLRLYGILNFGQHSVLIINYFLQSAHKTQYLH